MNKKEEKEVKKICLALNNLYDIVFKLELYCQSENIVIIESANRTEMCKKILIKYLDKIQKSADKLLAIDLIVKAGDVVELFEKDK